MTLQGWLAGRGMAFASKAAAPPGAALTHASMSGGVLAVPPEELAQFCERYAAAVRAGEGPTLTELKNPEAFRLHVDLDVVAGADAARARECCGSDDAEWLLAVLDTLSRAAQEAFGDRGRRFVACCAPLRPLAAAAGGGGATTLQVKKGVHVVWPDAVVDCQMAKAFRAACLPRLPALPDPAACSWARAFDEAVYGRGGGLRMVGARKPRQPGVYLPCWAVLDAGAPRAERVRGVSEATLDAAWVVRSSVRVWGGERPGADARARLLAMRHDAGQAPRAGLKQDGSWADCLEAGGGAAEPAPPAVALAASEALRAHLSPRMYREFQVTRVLSCGAPADGGCQQQQAAAAPLVVGTSSRQCYNLLSGEHRNNHIYFVIQPDGRVFQRCFCRCDTTAGRRLGRCSDLRELVLTLGARATASLFPPPQKTATRRHNAAQDDPRKRLRAAR